MEDLNSYTHESGWIDTEVPLLEDVIPKSMATPQGCILYIAGYYWWGRKCKAWGRKFQTGEKNLRAKNEKIEEKTKEND